MKNYTKDFFVADRDGTSPLPESWITYPPKAFTKEALQVRLNESLDYFLLQETIEILDQKNRVMEGSIQILNNEKGFSFIPVGTWQAGRYKIRIASYLEDLAGNNIQRVFDRDVTKQPEKTEVPFVEKAFIIAGK